MAKLSKFVSFPPMPKVIGIGIIAILAVTVASTSGLLSPVTGFVGRAVGSVMAAFRSVFGGERRAA